MFECLSDRQASYAAGQFRRTRELPFQVGVGLTIHKQTRSAKLVDLACQWGVSVNYERVRGIENDIARAVLKRFKTGNGVFLPPELKRERFVHFAADNLDFQEDTPDGKQTLYVTVLCAYQAF